MTVEALVESVVRAGGVLKLEGDSVRCKLPNTVAHLAVELRANKPELVEFIRRAGGRIAAFPHCPGCCGYALYREDNIGNFECLTCGQKDIEEQLARRLQ